MCFSCMYVPYTRLPHLEHLHFDRVKPVLGSHEGGMHRLEVAYEKISKACIYR